MSDIDILLSAFSYQQNGSQNKIYLQIRSTMLNRDFYSPQGNTVQRMPSGAGHDAQMLARVCPAGMIFVPSVKGISHNAAEFTQDADLEAGANILLHTMLALTTLESQDQ